MLPFKRFWLVLCFLFLSGSSLAWADSKPAAGFSINGKPVPDVVATVNGEKLPSQFLENQVVTYKLQLQQMGRSLNPKEEETFAKQTLSHLVDQELLFQKREELGLKVDSGKVDKEVERIESEFPSKELFLRALAAQRLDMTMLRESVTKRILEDEFIRHKIAPEIKVTPDTVQSYYDQHKDEFKKPERYKIQHIYVAALHPNPPAEDAPDAVKQKAKRFREMVDQDARKKIAMIHDKLKKGANFEDTAKEHSEDENSKEKGGLLGEVLESTVFPEMAAWLPKLKPGEYTPPIKTPLGYHIMKLTEKLPEESIPLKKVETQILNHLLRIKVQEAREVFLKDLRKSARIKLYL